MLGLRTAVYPSPDLARGKALYRSVLGVDPYFDEPFYVGFAASGFELGLVPDAQPGLAGARVYWGVSDIGAEHARLLALGATPLDAITDVGDGIQTAAVRDPMGNAFGLIQNPHFKLDLVR